MLVLENLPISISSKSVTTPPVDSLQSLRTNRLSSYYMRSECQHSNSSIMEYRVISSDSHFAKHYTLICICIGCEVEFKLSFLSFKEVVILLERELFRYPK